MYKLYNYYMMLGGSTNSVQERPAKRLLNIFEDRISLQ